MSEIVVTIKAGTGFNAPWIVIHADTVSEAEAHINESLNGLVERVSWASKVFAHTFDTMPSDVASLLAQELGAEVMTVEPAAVAAGYVPTGPMDTSPPTAAPAPWERPAPAAAPMPWETSGAAASSAKILFKLPYAEKNEAPGSAYSLQGEFKNYCFQQRNKLNWNKERKGFEFTSTPSGELLDIARQWTVKLGGTVEG